MGGYLRKLVEGPGRPLTVLLTCEYSGNRGLLISTAKEYAPYLELEVRKPVASGNAWWAAFITIPKNALGLDDRPLTLRADLFRRHGDEFQQWSPALEYLWQYPGFPKERRGKVIFQ